MYVLAPNQIAEKFPYSIGDLRKDNSQISFPANPNNEVLAFYNVFPVVSTGVQYDATTQVAEQNGCAYDTDKQRWQTAWTVRDMTEAEVAQQLESKSAAIRQQRDALLVGSDWTQVLDAPVNQALWSVYRQALRDITTQAGFPWTIEWPTEP